MALSVSSALKIPPILFIMISKIGVKTTKRKDIKIFALIDTTVQMPAKHFKRGKLRCFKKSILLVNIAESVFTLVVE